MSARTTAAAAAAAAASARTKVKAVRQPVTNKAKETALKVIAKASAHLSAADVAKLKALTFLSMGRCAANRDDVILNLRFKKGFMADPVNGFLPSLADQLVQLADEHERLLQQEAPEAELQLLAMVVEAVWSALMGAMEAKGFADKLPKDEPDVQERETEALLRALVSHARDLTPRLNAATVLGRILVPAIAALLGRPVAEVLPAVQPVFDAINGRPGLSGLIISHLCAVRELACVRKIISGLPHELNPSALADGLARQRPLPDLAGMRALVTSRLADAGAAPALRDSVSACIAAAGEELREMRAAAHAHASFASGAQLAAHLRRQLCRRVELHGQELYSGGGCALDTMRLMAAVAEPEETQAFERLAHPEDGLGGYMGSSCTLGKMWLAGVTSLAEEMHRTLNAMQCSAGVTGLHVAASPLDCLCNGMAVVALTPAFMNRAARVVEHLQRVDKRVRRIIKKAQMANVERTLQSLGAYMPYLPEMVRAVHMLRAVLPHTSPAVVQQAMRDAAQVELPALEAPPQADTQARKRWRNKAGGDGGDEDAATAADTAPQGPAPEVGGLVFQVPPAKVCMREDADGVQVDDANKRLRQAGQPGGKVPKVVPPVDASDPSFVFIPPVQPPAARAKECPAGNSASSCGVRTQSIAGGGSGPVRGKSCAPGAVEAGSSADKGSDGASAASGPIASTRGGGVTAAGTHIVGAAGVSRAGLEPRGGGVHTRVTSGAATPSGAAASASRIANPGSRAAEAAGGGAAAAAAAPSTAADRGAAASPLQAAVRRGGPAAAATSGATRSRLPATPGTAPATPPVGDGPSRTAAESASARLVRDRPIPGHAEEVERMKEDLSKLTEDFSKFMAQ